MIQAQLATHAHADSRRVPVSQVASPLQPSRTLEGRVVFRILVFECEHYDEILSDRRARFVCGQSFQAETSMMHEVIEFPTQLLDDDRTSLHFDDTLLSI